MAGLHFDATLNNSDFIQKTKEIEKGIREAANVMEKESKRLEAFDDEVVTMCGNLDRYFNSLLDKANRMSSLLQGGKISLNSPAVSNDIPSRNIEELRLKNAELTEQLRIQSEDIKKQQAEWNNLANAIKSNNVDAIRQYRQANAASTVTIKEAKVELKGLVKDLDENIKYYDKLAAQAAAYTDELAKLKDFKDKGGERVVVGDNGTSRLVNDVIEETQRLYDGVRESQKGVSLEISTQQKRQRELNAVIEQGNEKNLRTRTLLMDAREQLIQMRASGLQNTVQYQQAAEEVGKMRKQMVLVNAEMAYLANPDRNLAAVKAGLSGIASSASLVVGVMGLVNQKNEEMVQLQTKVQSLMGLIIGLEGTYNMVKKSSILMLTIENVQRKASIASQALEAKAKKTNIALTWAEVVAQKALNMVAKANPYILLATAIATVVGGIWLLVKANKENINIQEKANKVMEVQIKYHDELKNRINSLISVVRESTSTEFERVMAYKQLQSIMPTLFKNMDIETLKLREQNRLKKEINEQSDYAIMMGAKVKVVQAQDKYNRLNNSINKITENGGRLGLSDISDLGEALIELEAAKKVLSELEKIQEEANKLKNVPDIKNKEYWEKQKKEATTALESIESSKLELLEKAAKDPKKDLYGLGIDKTIVDSYKQNIKLKKEAEKQLIIYDDSKQENQAKKEAEKKLQQQQKLSDDLLSLRYKNQQSEIDLMEEGRERKLKQIDADFEAQKTAIQKKSREFADANKKAGVTGLNPNGLTAEQQAQIDKANKLNADSRSKAERDMYKAEAEAMRNYLKEYGTFQQQKLAIAEEYAEKIRKAQSEGERLFLAKQRDAALVNIDVQAAQQNIDWQSIFGDLGMMLREQIQPTIDNLKTIIQSDEFQSSSVEDRQKIYDILSRLEQQSGELGNGLFKEVAMDLEIYRNSLNAYNKAQQREIEATNRLIEAKNKLKAVQENGGDVDAAKQAVEEAQAAFNQASESVKTLGDKAAENAQTLKSSSEKARGAIEGLASGLSKLKSGSLQQAFEGIKDIGSSLGGKLGDAISNIDPTGIIGGVLGLLDILKDGVSTIFVSLQDTLFGAVEGILNDVLSGDIVTKTWSNAMSHVGNILNTVTFGGFNSLFGIGGNAKRVQEAIDRLTDRNETLEKSIDRLSDVMEKEAGSKSISAYEQAYKYQEEDNKNTLQIAREQARYHNSHKSWQYYMKWDDEQLQWARDNVDKNFSGTDSLWGLTPEQMKALLSNADIYDHMKNAGAGGYGGRVMEKLEAYADNAEKLDELTGRINESLMQVSFDSLRDSFLDSLMDMDKDAKGFSEDFSEYMQRALLNFSMGEMFDEDLKEWYDGIAKLMKDQGGELTEQQLKDAREGYDKIVKDALNERDKLAQITGYTGGKDEDSEDGRKAAQKGIATASQDSIDELKGTMTNVQGHTYNINENVTRIATGIDTLTGHTKHLTCLADIDNTMQSLLTMRKESVEHLSNIAEYTSNLVAMKEFMYSIKTGIDTLNTKGLTLKR